MNWLSPSAEVWERRFGQGTFPGGMAGKALLPLKPHHTPESIAEHLDNYLEDTPARFINLHTFARTFGEWATKPLIDERTGALTPYGVSLTRPRGPDRP